MPRSQQLSSVCLWPLPVTAQPVHRCPGEQWCQSQCPSTRWESGKERWLDWWGFLPLLLPPLFPFHPFPNHPFPPFYSLPLLPFPFLPFLSFFPFLSLSFLSFFSFISSIPWTPPIPGLFGTPSLASGFDLANGLETIPSPEFMQKSCPSLPLVPFTNSSHGLDKEGPMLQEVCLGLSRCLFSSKCFSVQSIRTEEGGQSAHMHYTAHQYLCPSRRGRRQRERDRSAGLWVGTEKKNQCMTLKKFMNSSLQNQCSLILAPLQGPCTDIIR